MSTIRKITVAGIIAASLMLMGCVPEDGSDHDPVTASSSSSPTSTESATTTSASPEQKCRSWHDQDDRSDRPKVSFRPCILDAGDHLVISVEGEGEEGTMFVWLADEDNTKYTPHKECSVTTKSCELSITPPKDGRYYAAAAVTYDGEWPAELNNDNDLTGLTSPKEEWSTN